MVMDDNDSIICVAVNSSARASLSLQREPIVLQGGNKLADGSVAEQVNQVPQFGHTVTATSGASTVSTPWGMLWPFSRSTSM